QPVEPALVRAAARAVSHPATDVLLTRTDDGRARLTRLGVAQLPEADLAVPRVLARGAHPGPAQDVVPLRPRHRLGRAALQGDRVDAALDQRERQPATRHGEGAGPAADRLRHPDLPRLAAADGHPPEPGEAAVVERLEVDPVAHHLEAVGVLPHRRADVRDLAGLLR